MFFIAKESSEAYDVVEDVKVEMNEVIEDNIFDNEEWMLPKIISMRKGGL